MVDARSNNAALKRLVDLPSRMASGLKSVIRSNPSVPSSFSSVIADAK
jgi:hypothetical protein